MEFSQKPEFKALKMIKIADFDLLKLPNLILRKICVSQNKYLGIFNTFRGGISSKIQNSGPENDQNYSFYTFQNWQL